MAKINYSKVDIPEDKDFEDYSWAERRAWILDRVIDVGHPRLISQQDIAEQFGVTPSQISKDVNELAESVSEHLGDDADFMFKSLYESAIETLSDEDDGDMKELRHWIREFKEFLQERGAINKAPEKHEIDKSEQLTVNIVPMDED